MSKTDMVGRITLLLIFVCVVPAGLELSILQARADGMPGLSRNESPCGDTTGGSASRSACNCPHCREANISGSPLRRFFKSRCTKWSERPPKHSWKYYHPCPPYFQPSFGIYQTSWNILPHDECQIPFAVPPVNTDPPSPSDTEFLPSQPPVSPEAPNEAIQGSVMPMATEISASDFDGDVREQAEVASPLQAIKRKKPKPLLQIPARRCPEAIVLPGGLEFDEHTPDSVFASQNQPFFRTQPAASGLAASMSSP